MTAKVVTTETGIETATIRALRMLRRKKSSTRKVSSTACQAVLVRLDMDWVMNLDRSIIVSTLTPDGSSFSIVGMRFATSRQTVTELASDCLCTMTITAGLLLFHTR
ncbi:MAG: hypothetical protein BWY83_00955 [bacterium ADurb.Bin478]|nr:MAG: hypothetical protein BWY83_00955 [bacterium ADurb.Bin478]